jgi:Fis family transcriptional regulator, factor for inversion stimulation protein
MKNENELARCVRRAIDAYFRDLDGELPTAVYEMVLQTVERPLLETVLARADGNRNTLRKKMLAHGLA